MLRSGSVRYLLAGAFHRMAWVEAGNKNASAVVCVHGLTRNGRDFDALAEGLADRFHVFCPDLPGRGDSDWLPDGMLYVPPSYVQALSHMLAVIDRPVAWIGTSLGAVCGMLIAGMPGNPVTHLVMNDTGPAIPGKAVARIRDYMSYVPAFDGIEDAGAHLRNVHSTFVPMTEADWQHLICHSSRLRDDGKVVMHYDPAIAMPLLHEEPQDLDLWPLWDQVRVPRMVLRGENSDLLDVATLERMSESGAHTITVAGAGHAPSLRDPGTIDAVKKFLLAA
jgi:pimeloyl-ACP methyl ester carboxylesterase